MPALAPPPVEATDQDRRGALRHPVKVPGTVSHPGLADVTVTLTDISDTGCQIERVATFDKGGLIRLSFAGFAPVDAAIMWSSPRAYGLQFDAPIHPALVDKVVQIGRGRRRSPRLLTPALVRREERERLWHVSLAVHVEDAAGTALPFEGTLSDLSVEGCRIASAVAVLPGCGLTLTLPGIAVLNGTVRWCSDGAIGLEFGHPLEATLVQAIAQG
jgi:hypothetical protein